MSKNTENIAKEFEKFWINSKETEKCGKNSKKISCKKFSNWKKLEKSKKKDNISTKTKNFPQKSQR